MSNSPSVRFPQIVICDFTRQDTVNRVLKEVFGLGCGNRAGCPYSPPLSLSLWEETQFLQSPSTVLRRCNSLPRGFGQPRPLPAKSAACGDSASEAKEVKKLGGTTHESVRVCWDVVKHCPSPPVGLRRASRKIARSTVTDRAECAGNLG